MRWKRGWNGAAWLDALGSNAVSFGAAPALLGLCLLAGCSSSGTDDAPTAAATAAPGAGQPATGQPGQPGAGQPPSADAIDTPTPTPGRPLPFLTVPALPSPGPAAAGSRTTPPATSTSPGSAATTGPQTTDGSGSTGDIVSLTGFQTPSGNIHCLLVSDDADGSSARCQVTEATWSPPPRPADCELDWGSSISVGSSGRADVDCAGDTVVNPGHPVLRYGQSSSAAGVRCSSRESGVTCVATATGRGFQLSRGAYRFF